MNKVRLSNYSDIDCSHNKMTTSILEILYQLYLLVPIATGLAIIGNWVVAGKVSSNLGGLHLTWMLASIILMARWPKYEPKTLGEIHYEEWVLNKQLPQ